MLPELLEGTDCATLCERWGIAPELAASLLVVDERWRATFPGLGGPSIISGFRTREEQEELSEQGRPAAPDDLSTHRSCPATGADLSLPVAVTADVKVDFGMIVMVAGLRWGGGSPLDEQGIPTDWNHVDLGPRAS